MCMCGCVGAWDYCVTVVGSVDVVPPYVCVCGSLSCSGRGVDGRWSRWYLVAARWVREKRGGIYDRPLIVVITTPSVEIRGERRCVS